MLESKSKIALPPVPPLEEQHLRAQGHSADGHGHLEALLPSQAPYICNDPNAPSLVLVPGLGMDGLGFLRQLPLGAISNLHLYQMPNNPPETEPGLDAFAHSVETYIKAAKLEQRPGGLILGGCSMGGAVSLAVAIRGRVKLRGLVLIGTFGASKHLPLWQRKAAPLAWLVPLGLMRRVGYLVIGRTRFFGHVRPPEAKWLVSFKLKRNQRYFARSVAALTRMDQIEAAKQLRLPTLVLHGTRDYVLPHAAGVELSQTIPGARFFSLQDAGHALFFTHHEPVNHSIAEFIVDITK